MATELIANHNISFRKKGKRITIPAGARFDPNDFADHCSPEEWKAMAENGNLSVPMDTSYVTPAMLMDPQARGLLTATHRQAQRAAASAAVFEGISPRTDVGENRTAETVGGITRPVTTKDEDDDEDEDDDLGRPAAAARSRISRRNRRKENRTEDDDNEV